MSCCIFGTPKPKSKPLPSPSTTKIDLKLDGETSSSNSYYLSITVQQAPVKFSIISASTSVVNPELISKNTLHLTKQISDICEFECDVMESASQMVGKVQAQHKRSIIIGYPHKTRRVARSFIFRNIIMGIFNGQCRFKPKHIREVSFDWDPDELRELQSEHKSEIETARSLILDSTCYSACQLRQQK